MIDAKNDTIPLKSAADNLNVSTTTIYSWIRKGIINATKNQGRLEILSDKIYYDLIYQSIRKKYEDAEPYLPNQIIEYHSWHQTIDYFAWLFKTCYTEPKFINKKQFNIRSVFENYIRYNKIDINKIKNQFMSEYLNKSNITNDLKRGWYNELSFIYPLKKSTLGLSFRDVNDNLEISTIRFTFPSWKITECYYSSYFYIRSIVQYKTPFFRFQEHKATLNSFKNSTLDSLKKVIWKFPLDIEYKPNTKFYSQKTLANTLGYINNKYCCHPRTPYLSPMAITKDIYSTFMINGKKFQNLSRYTIFDYLLQFRIWANYLDIDNLLSLYGEGYKSFLDQNLSLLLFFIAGITEIIYISVFGEEKYLLELQQIYELFAKNNKEIKKSFSISSLYQRMKIYKILGFISKEIDIIIEVNNNEVS